MDAFNISNRARAAPGMREPAPQRGTGSLIGGINGVPTLVSSNDKLIRFSRRAVNDVHAVEATLSMSGRTDCLIANAVSEF